jgi:hypothetical protein
MGHIPASRRGEVLLQKKMGSTLQFAPPSASQQSLDSFFDSNLSASHVDALDELFPAARTRAVRTTREPLAARA